MVKIRISAMHMILPSNVHHLCGSWCAFITNDTTCSVSDVNMKCCSTGPSTFPWPQVVSMYIVWILERWKINDERDIVMHIHRICWTNQLVINWLIKQNVNNLLRTVALIWVSKYRELWVAIIKFNRRRSKQKKQEIMSMRSWYNMYKAATSLLVTESHNLACLR